MSELKDNIIILDQSQYSSEEEFDNQDKPTSTSTPKLYPGMVPLEERRPERDPLPSGWTQEKHEDGLLYTYDENGKHICGAWNSRRRKYCKGDPIIGKNRCYFHGGPSPRGIEAPRYIHGGYSRDMTEQLAKRYREFQADTELLSLRNDIALTTAGIAEAVSAMKDGAAGELWVQGRKTYKELLGAIKRQDETESTRLMSELGRILESGYSNTLAWKDIQRKQDVKRKLVDSERKRLVDMRQMVTIEELMLVVGALVDSLKKHVHDNQALSYVSADLRKLLQDRGYADKQNK